MVVLFLVVVFGFCYVESIIPYAGIFTINHDPASPKSCSNGIPAMVNAGIALMPGITVHQNVKDWVESSIECFDDAFINGGANGLTYEDLLQNIVTSSTTQKMDSGTAGDPLGSTITTQMNALKQMIDMEETKYSIKVYPGFKIQIEGTRAAYLEPELASLVGIPSAVRVYVDQEFSDWVSFDPNNGKVTEKVMTMDGGMGNNLLLQAVTALNSGKAVGLNKDVNDKSIRTTPSYAIHVNLKTLVTVMSVLGILMALFLTCMVITALKWCCNKGQPQKYEPVDVNSDVSQTP
jgi:hypothetical protein